jgi:predicted LPLAT superfamily acyltransferase
MRPDNRYEIFVDEAIAVPRGHEERALQQMVHVLERYVAMAPDQWCNFYDIWHDTLAS